MNKPRTKKPLLLVSAALLLLSALAAWLFLENYQRIDQTRSLPVQGEARYNPLYALKLSLRELGQRAETHARLDLDDIKLGSKDTLLLYSPPNGLSDAQTETLVKWVQAGGHLIVSVPRPDFFSEAESFYQRLGVSPFVAAEDEEDEYRYHDAPCASYTSVNKSKASLLCGNRFAVDDAEWFSWLRGDEKSGYFLGRMPWGNGSVTVASDLDFMGNAQLQYPAARELSYQLLADSMGQGSYHLVYASSMSPLWLLLLKHGWMLIVPAFALLLAWLVYRSQRFGPLQASPNPDRRALLEHIGATGEYMFHRHLAHELHLATLALFTSRLRQRDPMTAALTGEAQIAALAERTKIDPQKIRQALKPGSLRQKENFLYSIATLIQLRNLL